MKPMTKDIINHYLETIELQINYLLENKPIIWTNTTTGEERIATLRETLSFINDNILFIQMELENDETTDTK